LIPRSIQYCIIVLLLLLYTKYCILYIRASDFSVRIPETRVVKLADNILMFGSFHCVGLIVFRMKLS
jgi:hypothetical protein